MSKVTMPEPVGFASFADGQKAVFWDDGDTRRIQRRVSRNTSATLYKLITTTQAEAYADARVAESQRWVSVDERLPDVGVPVLVYIPPGPDCHPSDVNIRFDFICPDYEYWHNHSEHYEHYCCVAKGGSGIEWSGPSEKAPYTHWMPLPAPPLPGPVEPTT